MAQAIVAGIDPGLVHTGLVVLKFTENFRRLGVSTAVIDGLDAPATQAELVKLVRPTPVDLVDVFIEKYRPRSGFSTNDRMMEANTTFPAETGGTLLLNMGVKKVVTPALMQLLDLWTFKPTTHHQDLRSAARIALFGMMRDDFLNKGLYTYTTHRLETAP